jgi:hypothetical protein
MHGKSLMTKRKIKIFADGGLGNRLSSLCSGLATARKLNLEPEIFWPENNWCGCGFFDLFELTDFQVSEDNVFTVFDQSKNCVFLIHENQTNLHLDHVYSHSQKNLDIVSQIDKDIVYYHNKIPDYHTESEIIQELEHLTINKHINKVVTDFCQQHLIDSSVAGLHLRKTENLKLNDSLLYQQVLDNPQQRYFVCSDDKNTQERFAQLPNVIAFTKTSYVEKLIPGDWYESTTDTDGRQTKYNINRSKQSVIEAFVDMLILGRTWIRPTVKSSFANFARYFAHANTRLNNSDHGHNESSSS